MATTVTQTASDDVTEHLFPPFPAYSGVSFKDFRPAGILLQAREDGIERDAKGVPTVALSKHHDLDRSKTQATNHKQFRAKIEAGEQAIRERRSWDEVWEATDSARDDIVVDP